MSTEQIEITPKMLKAGVAALKGFSSPEDLCRAVFAAMNAAAPKEKTDASTAEGVKRAGDK